MLGEPSSNMASIKFWSLLVMVVQSSMLVLLLRYSRTRGGALYYSSTVILLAECMKMLAGLILVAREYFHTPAAKEHMSLTRRCKDVLCYMRDQIFTSSMDVVKMSFPSVVYGIQNNLLFYALSCLDAATFQVLYQGKIVTTALLSRLILNTQITPVKWLSLALLTIGVALVERSSSPSKGQTSSAGEAHAALFVKGVIAVAIACFCSGFAGVFLEKMLKESKLSVWARNVQLSFFGALTCIVVMWQNGDWDKIQNEGHGFFYGYDWLTWTIMLNQAFGGLVVALVVKYLDNIIKGFANAFSIVIGCVVSVFLFDFRLSLQFTLGASLVTFAVYLYTAGLPPSLTRLLKAELASSTLAPADSRA